LRRAIRGPSEPRRPGGKSTAAQAQRFTLKIENQPVGRVLDQLARQLNLNVVWSTNPPAGQQALISCDVRQVDLDGLLEAILEPAGLTSRREGQTVTIQPAP
jgi:type II secretory pathway component HofQ